MKYNITQQMNIWAWIFSIFLSYPSACFAQNMEVSKYGVHFVKTIEAYHESILNDSLKKMTNLQSVIPNIVFDLRYATKNNFMGRRMYPQKTNHSFLRASAVQAISKVQKELNTMGYGLKIFDAYRPYSVTEKFWELVHDDRYVADPKKGSGHNRGIAVDLTIIELNSKKELKMPTGFDNFTDTAHHDFMALTEEVLKNRALLKNTMEKYGFNAFATEWWHYSLPNPEKYEVLDLSFEELDAAE
ncbi:MAG: M15 family metallopeptidase [Bacteroidetes bacterium]|nr:M15 family metallopeptidase [Bacteroidota bacterium]